MQTKKYFILKFLSLTKKDCFKLLMQHFILYLNLKVKSHTLYNLKKYLNFKQKIYSYLTVKHYAFNALIKKL
jgi:hypothetical protein